MILEDDRGVMDDNDDEVVCLLVAEAIMIANNNIKCMRCKALIDHHPPYTIYIDTIASYCWRVDIKIKILAMHFAKISFGILDKKST